MLLDDNTTTEIITDGHVSGYVFAAPSADGQRLEWVLFGNFRHANDRAMKLVPARDAVWQHASLATFARRRAGRSRVAHRHRALASHRRLPGRLVHGHAGLCDHQANPPAGRP